MSDLLDRMIARSTRTGDGVMPVLSSRYENSYISPAGIDTLEQRTNIEPRIYGRDDVRHTETSPISLKQTALKQTIRNPQHEQSVEIRPMPNDSHHEVPKADARLRTAPENESAESDRTPATKRGNANESEADIPADEPAVVKISGQNHRATTAADLGETARPQVKESPADLLPGRTVGVDRGDRRPVLALRSPDFPDARRSPHSRQDQSRQDHPPARREFETLATQAREPVEVHVSIGHIVVRQTAPPPEPPSQRRAPFKPPVSLKEYLKGRREGAR